MALLLLGGLKKPVGMALFWLTLKNCESTRRGHGNRTKSQRNSGPRGDRIILALGADLKRLRRSVKSVNQSAEKAVNSVMMAPI